MTLAFEMRSADGPGECRRCHADAKRPKTETAAMILHGIMADEPTLCSGCAMALLLFLATPAADQAIVNMVALEAIRASGGLTALRAKSVVNAGAASSRPILRKRGKA